MTLTPTDTEHGAGPAVIVADSVRIPLGAHDFEDFRRWVHSPRFPQTGRIDHLAGDVEVDMSPEDLDTHGAAKTAIIATLHSVVVSARRGQVFSDRTRVSSLAAGLSAEPDVVVVLWESLEQGRVRKIPAEGKGRGRFVELEGAPDLIVEILSDSSVGKDTERLPKLYARAGVPELWLVDARGQELRFEICRLERDSYVPLEPSAGGLIHSPTLRARFALERQRGPRDSWTYELHQDESPLP